MEFKSGKHAGKTTEEVLLKEPDFAQWYISKFPDAKHSKDLKRLIKEFDARPFTKECAGCGGAATRASAYRGSPSLMFWCAECNPYSSGAGSGRLRMVSTVGDVLEHIDLTANGSRPYKRRIVRELAEGKGLPKRVGKKQAADFFF
jgi:hypothetical protein